MFPRPRGDLVELDYEDPESIKVISNQDSLCYLLVLTPNLVNMGSVLEHGTAFYNIK